MTRQPDPDAQLALARDACQHLPDALDRLYAVRYTEDAQREPETPRVPTPSWRPHWTGPTKLQRAWHTTTQHLASAHHRLLKDTDCEPLWLAERVLGYPLQPTETGWFGEYTPSPSIRTVPLQEALAAVGMLEHALADLHADHQAGGLMPRETKAVLFACHEAQAALAAVPPGLRSQGQRCAVGGCQRHREASRTTCRRHRADRRVAA